MTSKKTKAELKAMEKKVHEVLSTLDDMTEEKQKAVVNQIVYADQIEIGEFEEENFVATTTELGLPLERKGRIPFDEVCKIGETMCEFLAESVNPKGDIKLITQVKTQEGLDKANESVKNNRGIRKRDKPERIDRNNKLHVEYGKLEEAGLKLNKNTLWSIYKIVRGGKRRANFEEDGIDPELMILQNSFLSNDELDDIYERRKELYGDD